MKTLTHSTMLKLGLLFIWTQLTWSWVYALQSNETLSFIYPKCYKQAFTQEPDLVDTLSLLNYYQTQLSEPSEGFQSKYPQLLNKASRSDVYIKCHKSLVKNHKVTFLLSDLAYEIDPTFLKNGEEPLKNEIFMESQEAKSIAKKLTLGVNEKYAHHVPTGYKVVKEYKSCQLGFHAIKVVPKDSQKNSCIFSVSGTDDVIDALFDLGLGKAQVYTNNQPSLLARIFDANGKKNSTAQSAFIASIWDCAYHNKKTIVTGHSLGGILAQYFAYRAQRLFTLDNLKSTKKEILPQQPIEVVTWNSPGGYSLVEAIEKEEQQTAHSQLSPSQVNKTYQQLDQYHYAMEGDMVSLLSNQNKSGVRVRFNINNDNKGVIKSHLTTTIYDRIMDENYVLFGNRNGRLNDTSTIDFEINKHPVLSSLSSYLATFDSKIIGIRERIRALAIYLRGGDKKYCAVLPNVVTHIEIDENSEKRPYIYDELEELKKIEPEPLNLAFPNEGA